MAAETEFCLLGPLVVRHGGVVVPVPAGKQRAVLAALLLSAGRLVAVDELAEALWGSGPPPSARASLQTYVMRLRKSLAAVGQSRITTQPAGYLISVGAGELDLHRFESSLAAGRAAARAGSWADAAAGLRAALSLWRGQPLSGVPSDTLALREVPRLAEMRLQAVEARIDADLHLGRYADVIIELRQLTAAHPLRERLHALLMIALYRDSQQAAALAAYRAARDVLVGELGAEPGSELRLLQQQILTADPALDTPRAGADSGTAGLARPATRQQPGLPVPRQLPGAAAHFAGRTGELAALTSLLDQAAGTGGTVLISAIAGTAGIGKTALAVHWAHQVASRFPDGQLYVNLHGYDPDRPMPAADALAGFLRALGVAGQDIPVTADERAARYRSLLAGRRMLVVADNASSAEQVRSLLPGTPACMAVVTSRDSLAGLVALDGARRLDLDLLPPGDAVGLLRTLIGARADADPGATAALAAQCSRLPLALRVAAELAVAHPAAPLADLVGELAGEQRRLDLLDAGGDPRTAVRAVFSWSYRHLEAAAARAFRLLGLHPGADLDRYAAAALTGSSLGRAGHLLAELARAHLTQPARPGRYGPHDLLRAYARELAAGQDSEADRRAALTRLFDYYLHTAAAAMDILVPAEHDRRPRIPPPATPAPPLAGSAAARAWLDTQRADLVAAAAHAAAHGWPRHATRLAAILVRDLEGSGHYPEAITIHTCARQAARLTGDRAAEATALTSLGVVNWRQGRSRQAADQFQQALVLLRETSDRTGEARALGNLGLVDFQLGRYQQAAGHFSRALALSRETGDRVGESRTLGNLGVVDERLGRYRQATEHLEQALAVFRDTGDRTGEAHALTQLGDVYLRQDRFQQAADHHRQALVLFRETGNRTGEAYALNGLGNVLLAAGRPAQARAQHTAALGLAGQIGDQHQQARAHNGLARSYRAAGDPGQARHHWQEALTLYTGLGAPEAAQVRAQLSTADNRG